MYIYDPPNQTCKNKNTIYCMILYILFFTVHIQGERSEPTRPEPTRPEQKLIFCHVLRFTLPSITTARYTNIDLLLHYRLLPYRLYRLLPYRLLPYRLLPYRLLPYILLPYRLLPYIYCFHHDNYCTTTDTYFTETPNGTSTGIAGLGFDVQRGPSSTDATCVFGTDRQIRGPLLYMRQYGLL